MKVSSDNCLGSTLSYTPILITLKVKKALSHLKTPTIMTSENELCGTKSGPNALETHLSLGFHFRKLWDSFAN